MAEKRPPRAHGQSIVPPFVVEDDMYRLAYGYDGKVVFFIKWLSGPIGEGCEDPNYVPASKISKWYPRAAAALKKQKATSSPKHG
jgi:hypothetical protein